MYKMLKIIMAEFSYVLEKYLGITSIIPTIIFIAVIYAIILTVILKNIETIYLKVRKRKKHTVFRSVYFVCAWVMSFIGNLLIISPQIWNSKMYRVMSNFKYILSFSANRQAFLEALALSDSTKNQANIFNIAVRLNDTQWSEVLSSTGDASWYFAKVEKAINQALRMGNYHMSINVIDQDICAYIPCVLIALLGVTLIKHHCKIEAIIVFLSALSSLIFSFGGAFFLGVMIYCGYFLWMYLNWLEKIKKDKSEKDSGV